MSDCIFCKIIAGQEPAEFLADGISSVAIKPLNPVVDGHFIVIPRDHVTDAMDKPGVAGMSMNDAALWTKMFSWRDKKYESVNFITSVGKPATQSVFHLHIHVVPRAENDGLALPWYSGMTEQEWGVFRTTDPDDAENPCDNYTFPTKERTQRYIESSYNQPEFWEPRRRFVGRWGK